MHVVTKRGFGCGSYNKPTISVTLMVLPRPQFLLATLSDCVTVTRLLLLGSGDVELNTRPTSDIESESNSISKTLKKILKERTETNKIERGYS